MEECNSQGRRLRTHPWRVAVHTRSQADLILLVGINPRFEATMLNVRIRQRFIRGGMTVATVGAPVNLTYDTVNLGLTPASLREMASGKHPFCKVG